MKKILKLTIIGLVISSLLFTVSASHPSQTTFEKSNVYKISTYPGSRPYGTAFSVDVNGVNYVLTNNHVCAVSGKAIIWAWNEYTDQWHKLEVIRRDDIHDLCLLQSPTISTGLKLGTKGGWLKDYVRILGHPDMRPLTESTGQIKEISEALVGGAINDQAKCNRPHMEWRMEEFFGVPTGRGYCLEKRESYIVDALIVPGSSGSPVFNPEGLVIGIVYAGGPNEGLYIGVEHINKMFEDLDKPLATCKEAS